MTRLYVIYRYSEQLTEFLLVGVVDEIAKSRLSRRGEFGKRF